MGGGNEKSFFFAKVKKSLTKLFADMNEVECRKMLLVFTDGTQKSVCHGNVFIPPSPPKKYWSAPKDPIQKQTPKIRGVLTLGMTKTLSC